MEQRDFFISYTNADEAWAVWIANVLKSNGYTAYVQALDIGPGDNFLEKMEEFVENSANFIAVWSKGYSESRYCMTEFRAAFQEWKDERIDCLLPVRVDEQPIKRLYSALVRVDLSNRDAVSETKLVDAVRYAVPYPLAVLNMDAESLRNRGNDYYFGGKGVAQDYAKARDYYKLSAKKGSAWGLNNLGVLYHRGLGVTRDYVKARHYYEQADAKGSQRAPFNLGMLYESGLGIAQDYATALEYYQKAADRGNDRAPAKVKELQEKLRGK